MVVVGLCLSLAEMTLACCYNFHAFGCSLALVGLVASLAFCYYVKRPTQSDDANEKDSVEEIVYGSQQY